MPTYVYQREDGIYFALEQRITEDALEVCPETGQKVHRVISATNFQLKGSGWYKTDYAGNASTSTSEKKSTEAKPEVKESSSEKKVESKPAKTESKKSSE